MADWKSLGAEPMLADGAMTEVNVNGKRVLLARVDGKYYATQAACAHMGAALPKGKLDGYTVTCPLHGSQYDVRDGSVIKWVGRFSGLVRQALVVAANKSPTPLVTYATRVEDGQVWVQVE